MIRIRTGTSWRHDPHLRAALRRSAGRAREVAARAIVDALAVEVDGIDIAGGRAEGALLPSVEVLLRAVARVVAGAPHAAVSFRDGELELVIRRRDGSALLTVVDLSRPAHVIARDVEVDLEALSAAALEGAADLCRDLAGVGPGAASRHVEAAARDLRRTKAGPAPRPRPAVRSRRAAPVGTRVACEVEVTDDEGVLLAYAGGRPDLGSLLAPGGLVVRAADAAALCAVSTYPFLALRDLVAAAAHVISALRRRDARCETPLARSGRAGPVTLVLDLPARTATVGGAAHPCPPLDLVAAVAEAALDFARLARARNPRQAENAYLVELESAAAERLAQSQELREGDRARTPAPPVARTGAPSEPRAPQEPLGPGRLRRLVYRRGFALDVGFPAGAGLWAAGQLAVAAGSEAVLALERGAGRVVWRAAGAEVAVALPGLVLAARGASLEALAVTSGRPRWSRPLPGAALSGAAALARGPIVLVERGAVTGIDPGSGRTLWRFEPPGAGRLGVVAARGIAVVAADTGSLYGLDAAGRLAWRLHAPGPLVSAPTLAGDACVVVAEVGAGTVLLAVDPATGLRRFEAALDLLPTAPPRRWAGGLAVAGTVGGDPAATLLDPRGGARWTVAVPLAGPPALGPAGALLALADGAGGVVALGRDGEVRWSRPAAPGHPVRGRPEPTRVRGTLLVPGDGVSALDARTGEILGAIPGVGAVRLLVDAALGVIALEPDGAVTGHRLGTHLSLL
jgi:outer membrane protein assembly factor BamB